MNRTTTEFIPGLSESPVLTGLIRAVMALRSRKGAGSVACPEKASGAKLCTPAERQSKISKAKAELLEPKSDRLKTRQIRNTIARVSLAFVHPKQFGVHCRIMQASLLSGGLRRNGSLTISQLSCAWNMGSPKQAGWPAWRRSPRSTQSARLTAGAVQWCTDGEWISWQQCWRTCLAGEEGGQL